MATMPMGEWTRRFGALPAEAYDCFMVRTLYGSTEYKRGSRGDRSRPVAGFPRIVIPNHPTTAVCRRTPPAAWARQAGDLQLPGLHLHLRQDSRSRGTGAVKSTRSTNNPSP